MSAISSFRRVLVGFDGSADAAEALRIAALVADVPGGRLVVLCVLSLAVPSDSADHASGRKALRLQAQALLGEPNCSPLPNGLIRASVKVVYSWGDTTANVVTDYAQDHGFDLLVLGRHGGGRRQGILGRVAEQAAHSCPVPVLLASAPTDEAAPN